MARQTRGRKSAGGSGSASDDTKASASAEVDQTHSADAPQEQRPAPEEAVTASDAVAAESSAPPETGGSESFPENHAESLGTPDATASAVTEAETGAEPVASTVPEAAQDQPEDAPVAEPIEPQTTEAQTTEAQTTEAQSAEAQTGEPDAPATVDRATDTTESTTGAPTAAPTAAPPPPAPPPPAAASRGGFFPMLLGGVVAGGIGYAVHYYLSQDADAPNPEIAALQAEVAQLRSELSAEPDLSVIETELETVRAAVESLDVAGQITAGMDALRAEFAQGDAGDGDTQLLARLTQLAAEISDMTTRLDGVEGHLAAGDAAIAAVQDDLSEIRDLAERRVAEAEAALDTALARAGLDMMRAALGTGAPYPEALGLLRDAGATVPDTLAANAASGVATLEMLQETFPSAARAALRAALQDMPADSAAERIANFLRAQMGARSTAPREGDDPDAVLSRAAAALEAGALDATLSELDALPDAALTAMQDWRARALARHDADAEFETFATTISNQ
ncbi:MAG: hypothetical protein JJU07_14455 [Natronohydrobacter sp.]|nr:hypothetical protein [Natronohydrobacter sp.]